MIGLAAAKDVIVKASKNTHGSAIATGWGNSEGIVCHLGMAEFGIKRKGVTRHSFSSVMNRVDFFFFLN